MPSERTTSVLRRPAPASPKDGGAAFIVARYAASHGMLRANDAEEYARSD